MHEWFAHENQPMALQKIYKRKRKWEIGVGAIDFRKATLTFYTQFLYLLNYTFLIDFFVFIVQFCLYVIAHHQ